MLFSILWMCLELVSPCMTWWTNLQCPGSGFICRSVQNSVFKCIFVIFKHWFFLQSFLTMTLDFNLLAWFSLCYGQITVLFKWILDSLLCLCWNLSSCVAFEKLKSKLFDLELWTSMMCENSRISPAQELTSMQGPLFWWRGVRCPIFGHCNISFRPSAQSQSCPFVRFL